MIQHRNGTLCALFGGVIAASLIAPPAQATPQSGFTGTQVMRGEFGDLKIKTKSALFDLKLDTKGNSDVYVTRNAIAGGGTSGWHTHPGPSLILVVAGTVTNYTGDDRHCASRVYTAGDGFIDPGSGDTHMLRNETGDPAETIAVQLLPKDAVRRLPADAPRSCPS